MNDSDIVINTKALLRLILNYVNSYVEVRVLLNGGFATHFLFFNGKVLFDQGCDGETRKIGLKRFEDDYVNAYWRIDNIV